MVDKVCAVGRLGLALAALAAGAVASPALVMSVEVQPGVFVVIEEGGPAAPADPGVRTWMARVDALLAKLMTLHPGVPGVLEAIDDVRRKGGSAALDRHESVRAVLEAYARRFPAQRAAAESAASRAGFLGFGERLGTGEVAKPASARSAPVQATSARPAPAVSQAGSRLGSDTRSARPDPVRVASGGGASGRGSPNGAGAQAGRGGSRQGPRGETESLQSRLRERDQEVQQLEDDLEDAESDLEDSEDDLEDAEEELVDRDEELEDDDESISDGLLGQ